MKQFNTEFAMSIEIVTGQKEKVYFDNLQQGYRVIESGRPRGELVVML
jgi:hypothetical protein